MEPTFSPDSLVLGFLSFLVMLGSMTGLVLGVARRRGWIASLRHPLGGPTTHG